MLVLLLLMLLLLVVADADVVADVVVTHFVSLRTHMFTMSSEQTLTLRTHMHIARKVLNEMVSPILNPAGRTSRGTVI